MERAELNAEATKRTFGTRVMTWDGYFGIVVAVDVRDQFGLGDDMWLVQRDDGPVTAEGAGDCRVIEMSAT